MALHLQKNNIISIFLYRPVFEMFFLVSADAVQLVVKRRVLFLNFKSKR